MRRAPAWIRVASCLALAGVFAAAASAEGVSSISISPVAPVLPSGSRQLFTATATYLDGFTSRLSNATLAAGGNVTCTVTIGGGTSCWGSGGEQLGNGSASGTTAFAPVRTGDSFSVLAGGFNHHCGIRYDDGQVQCWGRGTEGQLGTGLTSNSNVPVTVTGLAGSTAIAIGAGFQHSCALLESGGVRCWGANGTGQLGDGTMTPSPAPVAVSGITTAIGIAVGGNNSCAVLASGAVRCWGANNSGQLGNGSAAPASAVPVAVTGISSAVSLAAGFDYHCALLAGGDLLCWGRGLEGQLGNGGQASSALPVPVALGGARALSVSAALGHTCALISDLSVRCWGNNGNGQLGNGTLVGTFPTPAPVLNLVGAIAITTGSSHSCATLFAGPVRCWGLNQGGQLGNESTVARTGTPVGVNGIAQDLDAGFNHTCAISLFRNVSCWGYNHSAQLGHAGGDSPRPEVVGDIDDVVELALGLDHTCALRANGTVGCWGSNAFGQLGNGNTDMTLSITPQTVFAIDTAVAIAAGKHHTCARLANGTMRCWGLNTFGQLGSASPAAAFTPVVVPFAAGTVLTVIAAGEDHTCAALSVGGVRCWGRGGEGRLGNGGTDDSATPVAVTGIGISVTGLAAGRAHTCALLGSQVRCWGRGDEGQLGNGGTADALTSVLVINLFGVSEISAGLLHTCARLGGTSVRCWGRGIDGALGNGVFENRADPQLVTNLPNVSILAMDAGQVHTCAVMTHAGVRCWGNNAFGQLGDGGFVTTALAVPTRGLPMEAVALFWNAEPLVAIAAMSGHVQSLGVPIQTFVTAQYGPLGAVTPIIYANDADGDAVLDPIDNCTLVPNADQRDTNGDEYGNVCDADLNDSEGPVNFSDLSLFRGAFGTASPDADFDGSGGPVNFADLALFRSMFGRPPGPSGYHTP
jgi:alpha-tubulin suppressor-like RCC1 family protein